MRRWVAWLALVLAGLGSVSRAVSAVGGEPRSSAIVFPGASWADRPPEELGLDGKGLDELAASLGGRGCVIKDGWRVKAWGSQSLRRDWASSAKPVLSTLLFFAVHEGKLPGVDARVAATGWALKEKDAPMTFAHLANMTSGYARPEPPGAAWAYNDFAIMLYQKTLFDRVFADDADTVAASRFAPLRLEDGLAFDPRRRLSASVRDFARLSWFWLNKGEWSGKPVLPRRFFDAYVKPHVPSDLPNSQDDGENDDYLAIGTYGGGSNHFSTAGPGTYGFNWWFNAPVPRASGRLTWPDAPADAFMTLGVRGNCALIIPSHRLVVVAAEANWGQNTPGDPGSVTNRLIKRLLAAERPGSAASPRAQAPAAATAPTPAATMPVEVVGERKTWHPLSLTFRGPAASESADPNPFRDFRLTLTFARGGKTLRVPGYFAADGRAGETGAVAGDRWRARFLPDEPGDWSFHAELVQGPDAALRDDATTRLVGQADGSFHVGPTDKRPPDARGKGLLRDVRGRYFVFAGTNTPFIKGGADSPENLLAFADFDGTKPTHRFAPHAQDWKPGDPTWSGGRGKNLIGALNYLAGKGVNCIYFLTMNVKGDGKDVWPWTGIDVRDRFDVSKLDQWDVVFDHMDRLGILLHVVHQEQENDQLLDGGELGPTRRLYYRELIARFAHHPALVWNLGEENTNTTAQLKSFARSIRGLDAYSHPIVVHTFPNQYDKVYGPLLGDPYFSGASLQVGNMVRCGEVTATWLKRSADAGRPWAAFLDEIGPAQVGVKPDAADPDHDDVRRHALWAPLMAGGSGAEWLFGYQYPHNDINLEDFRSRDRMWDQTRWAREFFDTHVPVRETAARPELAKPAGALCLAKPGTVYAVYLPQGGTGSLTLEPGRYEVSWYDPRAGGPLQNGTVKEVEGPGERSLGEAPSNRDRDWTVLVRRK